MVERVNARRCGRTCSSWRAGPEEAVETEINEKLADEKFVESSNVERRRRQRGEGKTDSSGRRINYVIRHDCHVSVCGRSKGIRFLGFILLSSFIQVYGGDDYPVEDGRAKETRRSRKMFLLSSPRAYIDFFFLFFFIFFLFLTSTFSFVPLNFLRSKGL